MAVVRDHEHGGVGARGGTWNVVTCVEGILQMSPGEVFDHPGEYR